MKKQSLIILFLFISQFITAQQRKIDSVQKLYVTTTVDTLKIKYAYQLAELHFAKPETAIPYANAGSSLAERLKRLYDIAYGKGILASCYGEEGNYPLAVKNLFEALQISKQINNSYLLSGFYGLLGSIYDDQKDEQKAIYYTREQIVWAKKIKIVPNFLLHIIPCLTIIISWVNRSKPWFMTN
ncbi:MAG TPA: tetratricopeptide repeat protein [Candidatus Babeliaceae bacterium]|nr:tetratricopeptide repeat protein [Candidatus Babeliaceae bacterium]